METAFRGEQLHEWDQVPASSVSRLQGELDKSRFTLYEFDSLGIFGVNFMMNPNTDGPRPWHKDVRVRQAIYRLTNRQQILDLVFDSRGVLTTGPIHTSLAIYQLDKSETDKYFKEDVNEAKQLFQAAGYDTSHEWEDITSNSSATNAQAGEVFQNQLARGGFKFRINPIPLGEYLPNHMSVGKYDFTMAAQPGGDVPDRAMRNQASDTGDAFNNCGLFDPDVDALIAKSEQATDRQENIDLVKQIQRKALDAYSLSYVMFTLKQYNYLNAKVKDYFLDPVGGQDYQTQAWFSA
jgi:ABC-type transport system substrate-binding protein